MAFNFMSRKAPVLNALTEEDIRNRLYGSAVGISTDALGGFSRKQKSIQKEILDSDKEPDRDRSKISGELAELKLELEQARRRLDRMKGVSAKKIRLIIISAIVAFLIILLAAMATRKIFYNKDRQPKPKARVAARNTGKINYAVQVAVSAKLSDAQNLKSDLKAKGYKPFINKSSYSSGKDKFTIYVGSFNDKKSANDIAQRLKKREGIKDSFVVNIPK